MTYQSPGERERHRALAAAQSAKASATWRNELTQRHQETFELIGQLVAADYPCSCWVEKVVRVPPHEVDSWPADKLYRDYKQPPIPPGVSARKARRLAQRPEILTVWGVSEVIRGWLIYDALYEDQGPVSRWEETPRSPRYRALLITEEATVPRDSTLIRSESFGRLRSTGDRFAKGFVQIYPADCFVPLNTVLTSEPKDEANVKQVRVMLIMALQEGTAGGTAST